MEILKVFECYSMPYDLRSEFFEDYSGLGNSCYVRRVVEPYEEVDGTVVYDNITKWLIDQGCQEGEEVLISHTW